MKYRDFAWVKRVIESCIQVFQVTTPITRLIHLFKDKYNDDALTELLYRAKRKQLNRILYSNK